MSRRLLAYVLPGLTKYETAWRYQKVLSEHIYRQKKAAAAGDAEWPPDHLLLLEHQRVFTLGRGATRDNLKFDVDDNDEEEIQKDSLRPEVLRVERGGEVTWHGPGQLVAYPILDINTDRPGGVDAVNAHKKDLHWYSTQLEETVIRMLQGWPYSLQGVGRHDVNTGVWITSATATQPKTHAKISAIGITASRWITMHGLSLNVSADMADYGLIVPCGILEQQEAHAGATFGVTSIKQQYQQERRLHEVDIQQVRESFLASFQKTFDVHIEKVPDPVQALEDIVGLHPDLASLSLSKKL